MAIRLSDFDAIGFDVDHTLVQYKLENLCPMVYNSLAKYLVEIKDYPKELIEEPFEKYADFCSRGLILESEKGNFVKISKDGIVIRASHGTQIMSEEKLKEEYGEDRQWGPFKDFLDEIKDKGSFLQLREKYRMFENFFDMPAMLLCARLIDVMDSQDAGNEKDNFVTDLLLSLIENFDYRSFKENKGYFYPSIKADIHKYVHPISERLKEWLRKLRKDGRKLFLITNSQADFSMFVLEAAFGNDWLSYFDVAISRARKPGFFRNQHHFVEVVDGVANDHEVKELEEGKYYAEGNSTDLERFFGKLINKTDVKVLFCGDSLISDVYPPKYFANWDTVSLLEELRFEMKDSTQNNKDGENKNNENGEPDLKKPKRSEHSDVDGDELRKLKSILQSSSWGSIFGEDGRLMNTMFSSLVEEYSSLVVPSIECLTELTMDYAFVKNCNSSSRFYPSIPENATIAETS